MAYIGKQPLVGNYISCDSLSASATTTYNLASSGTPVFPTVPQNCIVSLNGVVQAPVTSFTISGATIVFSTTLSTTDSIDYITVLGSTLNIGTPSNNTVGLSQLSATGTPSSTTFLRGDNSWAAPTDLVWQSVQTTNFTATAAKAYPVNTTSAGITVTLPASPTAGDQVQIVDYAGTADTNPIVINPNSNKIESGTGNLQLGGEREGVILTYIDSTQGWIATSGINEGTDALSPPPYSIDFLVVAGGGGGGEDNGGGGGAGGYRTSTQTVNSGTVITVTVGDGGAGSGTLYVPGTNGSASSISGSGLTTISSAGGGGGSSGASGTTGNGGSGGGGGNGNSGGTGNTPSTSPSQGNNGGTASGSGSPYFCTGGGGGASAVGTAGTSTVAGNGGNGTASSITGSSVTRAGGGGGSGLSGGTGGTAGSGGGGTGGLSGGMTAGTANTGGGGGGSGSGVTGAAGGKGVVILSIPTASYSGTTTGSPTVTTSGSNTILQFNGDGSYTA
jgi:hypothetical protein